MQLDFQTEEREHYLRPTEVVDFQHPEVSKLACLLREGCKDTVELAQKTFVYVRDEIHHSADLAAKLMTQGAVTTLADEMVPHLPAELAAKPMPCKASEVLLAKEGICFSKAHLLAALLRHNGIPAGFCYQRFRLYEDLSAPFIFHGLNALFLQELGRWVRVDARGNKSGVDAQFSLEAEQLAFKVVPELDEKDFATVYADPPPGILRAFQACPVFGQLWKNIPSSLE